MAHDKKDRCPGCSKHCPAGNPRCKYGRAYFAKLAQQAEKKQNMEKKPEKKTPRWAAYVEKDGLAWQLLSAGRSVKKTLKDQKATEAQIMSALTDAEKAALSMLLAKLGSAEEN